MSLLDIFCLVFPDGNLSVKEPICNASNVTFGNARTGAKGRMLDEELICLGRRRVCSEPIYCAVRL